MRWRWLPVLAPAVLGLAISLILNRTRGLNPTLIARAQVSVIIGLLGIGLTVLAAVGLLIVDRAERNRLESELQSAAERRRFLRRLDHELKNPITAILAGLANLTAALQDESHQETLTSVQSQVQRLSRLVADLRKLSDLETRPLERTPVDIGELLTEVYELAQDRPDAGERELVLTIPQAPWPLPAISGDWDLLFLAAHNLLDNAIKFTAPGDRLEVRAFEDDNQLVIEVADTGPGIPDEEVPHVWDELYRGQSARGVSGSGLGLALVRGIVLRHNGEVDIRSRSGQGTVFTVRLPIGDGVKS